MTDFTGPQFSALTATEQGANTVVVADVDDAAGVARVLVQVLRNGQYSRIELVRQTGTPGRWAGTVPGTDVTPVQEATYFAIDANGNTSSANNKGPGYIPLPAVGSGPAALVFSPAAPSASGWFLTRPTVVGRRRGLPRADRRDGHASRRRRRCTDGSAHGVRLRSGRARS